MAGGNRKIHLHPNSNTNGFDKRPENIGNGRKKGVRNRSTVIKELLEQTSKMPEDILKLFNETFPDLPEKTLIEYAMTYRQIIKALHDGDTNAYKALMDSAYGAPKQEFDGNFGAKIEGITFVDD